jgi:hypothetical protein
LLLVLGRCSASIAPATHLLSLPGSLILCNVRCLQVWLMVHLWEKPSRVQNLWVGDSQICSFNRYLRLVFMHSKIWEAQEFFDYWPYGFIFYLDLRRMA